MMKNDLRYRHELKFLVRDDQLALLRMRLAPLTQADRHADPNGSYTVRSVYFDDIKNSCFYDNEDGNDNRKKYRIRTYNRSDAVIHLERKQKNSGLTCKDTCTLDREIANRLIRSEEIVWNDAYDPLFKRFFVLKQTAALSPKVIVEYDRTPFVYPDGNVRITFDRNIRVSNNTAAFFEKDLQLRPIMPMGQHILEVKYDRILPDFFPRILAQLELKQITFSKYYIGRKSGGLL